MPKAGHTAGLGPLQQLLPLQEAKARIEAQLKRSLEWVLLITAATSLLAVVIGQVLSLPGARQAGGIHPRALGALLMGALALSAWVMSRRHHTRWAIAWFSAALYLLSTGLATWLGIGVASAANSVPVALVVIVGFMLGTRAGLIATGIACLGTLGMLALERSGLISGLTAANQPPAANYALVQITVYIIIGLTIAGFSKLFWGAMRALDEARLALADKVQEQVASQQALVESQQQLHNLLDQVPLAVLIFSPQGGQLQYANAYALKAHGASTVQELAAKHLFPKISPTRPSGLRDAMIEVQAAGSSELRWCTRHADGHDIWWLVKLNTLPQQGTEQLAAYAQDITARLQAEQALFLHQEHLEEQVRLRTAQATAQQRRLAGIIDALPVILTIKDREGLHLLSNRQFEEATGKTKAQLLGCTIEALHEPEAAALIRQQDKALLNGAPPMRHEFSHRMPDGQSSDMLITKVALCDDQGQPDSVLTLGIDISDIKSLQRALHTAKTEAERLTRVMSEFLANMSHEIRTPLHGMLGLAYVGQGQDHLSPETRQTFEKITASGKHLQGIIDAILDFSKIDAGKMVLNECALDPHQLVGEVIAMLEPRALSKGLRLHQELLLSEQAILGDPLRLRQILINLLSNAIKFTTQGSVTLRARVDEQTLVLDLQDTGIGMDESAMARIFSPFEQADGSTSRRFGGSGLGLSISRQLARLMGGDIQVQSSLGRGSTFTLSLPWRLAPPSSLPLDTAAPAASALTPSSLAGLRVLAVDDVEINLDIVQGLLGHEGALLTLCSSGKEALQAVKAQPKGWFDVVLMDVQMPVMNGMQATELLHMVDPDLPVIALTAHAKPEERQQFLDVGMIGHLAKPFEPDALMQALLKHTRRAPSPMELQANSTPRTATTPTTVDLSHIDIEGALRRCAGKIDLLRRLLTRYSTEHRGFVAHCQTLAEVDFEEARQYAHMFRGISANLGMASLAMVAGQFEDALHRRDKATADATLQDMAGLLTQHLLALDQWLAQEPSPA
jgi:PAS domain S-box-containing protein